MPIYEFIADADGSFASLQPQPSRASLRKKRIRKDKKGYVDLLFTVDIEASAYANNVNLKLVSDGYYPITCNFEISVWDPQLITNYGIFIVTNNTPWRIGEVVRVGDDQAGVTLDTEEEEGVEDPEGSQYRPFASIFNDIFVTSNYAPGAQFIVRITFDREDFYTWDRGFFLRPSDNAPKLIFDVGAFVSATRGMFFHVENVIPPPTYKDLYILGSEAYTGQRDMYIVSQAFDTRNLFIAVYEEFVVLRNVYIKSTRAPIIPPDSGSVSGPDPTERILYWEYLSGQLESDRELFFPITDAIEDFWYINGNFGSDDFTLQESKNQYTPLRTIEWFFDTGGGVIANDLDVVSIDGTFIEQLIFSLEFFTESAATPVRIIKSTTSDSDTIIEGHIASETSCVTNIQFENITFRPSYAVNTVLSGTTQHMIYLRFCDPDEHPTLDPYYSVTFKQCKFFVPTTFSNGINSLIYFDFENTNRLPTFVTFDQCLVGVDGPGSLEYFAYFNKMYNINLLFRNCSFFNPFEKRIKTAGQQGSLPKLISFNGIDRNTKIQYANCAFWNFNLTGFTSQQDSALASDQPEFFRCFDGDPLLISNIIGNANFGKYTTVSPCYRQWLPRYGQNVGWDQDLPYVFMSYSSNIYTLKVVSTSYPTNVAAILDIKDKYIVELSASFGAKPYIADTNIITRYTEKTLKLVTEIPNIKTLIARVNTTIDGSHPVSTDIIKTELLLLRYPRWTTEIPNIKEIYSNTLASDIRTGWDTEPPYVVRYGIPEWYEPIYGDTVYYYFEVIDLGTGVDISSLIITLEGVEYRYGSPEIGIEPLKANKQAYRISFLPPNDVLPDQILELEIKISDCVQNKGPIWDARTYGTVLNYEELTPDQKINAMIPCFFTLYWGDKIYEASFEGVFPPYIHIRDWLLYFEDDYEPGDIRGKFVDRIYAEQLEWWEPYRYVIEWAYLYSDEIDALFNVLWNGIYSEDVDNMALPGPPTLWQIVYFEVDPLYSTTWIVLFVADTYEYRPPMLWNILYQEGEITIPPYTIGFYYDTFEYKPDVIWAVIYYEVEPSINITWIELFDDDLEWWDPYRNIVYIDIYDPYFDKTVDYILTLSWGQIYIDIEEEPEFAGRIAIDNFEWWEPYHQGINLGQDLEWNLFYSDDLIGPEILWRRIFIDDTDITAIWGLLYADDFDYLSELTSIALFTDSFDWATTIVWEQFHEDDLEYDHEELISIFILSDAFEWATDNGFNNRYFILFIDGFESEFLPYRDIVWTMDPVFEEYYIALTNVFQQIVYYIDDFEFTIFVFKTTTLYQEKFEYLGIFEYALQQTYRFELVVWEDDAFFTEDFEDLVTILEYSAPYEENFEWDPVVFYVTEPQAEETFELDLEWSLLFVDDLESW